MQMILQFFSAKLQESPLPEELSIILQHFFE